MDTDHSDSGNKEFFKYWAFISYSSKDRLFGEWLIKRLENYPIPKDLRGQRFDDGTVLGKFIRPVFRDREELPGDGDLGTLIRQALKDSRFLIVVCSPHSAKSNWVNKEILEFQAIGKERKILALITDGEPNSGDPASECFPEALRRPFEPVAGDLRREGDGKERGFLKILSGIAQLDFDQVYQRHRRAARQKRVSLMLGLLAVGLVLAWAYQSKEDAKQKAQQAQLANYQKDLASNQLEKLDKYPEEIRGWEYDFLAAQSDMSISKIPGKIAGSTTDGKFLTSYHERRIVIRELGPGLRELGRWEQKDVSSWGISADGNFLAVSNVEGVGVLDTRSKRMLAEWEHPDPRQQSDEGTPGSRLRSRLPLPTKLALSPNGERLAVAYNTGEIIIWDVKTRNIQARFPNAHDWEADFLVWADNDAVLLSASSQYRRLTERGYEMVMREGRGGYRRIRLWNVSEGKSIVSLPTGRNGAKHIIFTPNGQSVVLGRDDGKICSYTCQTGKLEWESQENEYGIDQLRISPTGRYVIATDNTNAVLLDRQLEGRTPKRIRLAEYVMDLDFNPDEQFVAIADGNRLVFCTLPNFDKVHAFTAHKKRISGCRFLESDSRRFRIASCSDDQTLRIWRGTVDDSDEKTGTVSEVFIRTFPANTFNSNAHHTGLTKQPGHNLLSTNIFGGGIQFWDIPPASPSGTEETLGSYFSGWRGAVSPSGGVIIVDHKLFDTSSLRVKYPLEGISRHLHHKYAFTPQENQFVAIWNLDDALDLHRFDTQTGRITQQEKLSSADNDHKRSPVALHLSSQAEYFLFGNSRGGRQEGLAEWYDLKTSNQIGAIPFGDASGNDKITQERCAFSPDGEKLAIAKADHKIAIVTSRNGVINRELEGHTEQINCLQWSSNGNFLYSCANDGTARIWNPVDGNLRGVLECGEGQRAKRVCLSPSGDSLVVASVVDNSLLFSAWSLKKRKRLADLEMLFGHDLDPEICFSPDGSRLAVAGATDLAVYETFTFTKLLELNEDSESFVGFTCDLTFSKDGRVIFSPFGMLDSVPWESRYREGLHPKPLKPLESK